jgi:hypothetical protein
VLSLLLTSAGDLGYGGAWKHPVPGAAGIRQRPGLTERGRQTYGRVRHTDEIQSGSCFLSLAARHMSLTLSATPHAVPTVCPCTIRDRPCRRKSTRVRPPGNGGETLGLVDRRASDIPAVRVLCPHPPCNTADSWQ